MVELLMLMAFWGRDMSGPVAVHAAYVIHTAAVDEKKCCGACVDGSIVHGDGHRTPCPCPPDCQCKVVTHPPVIIKCEGGKCSPKK